MHLRILLPALLAAAFYTAHAEPPVTADKQVPAWAAGAVWYQIFPERFRNGDPHNDPTRASLEKPIRPDQDWRISSWTADWYARDDWETALGPDFKNSVFDRRYGGDLQGVLDKLDYLSSLGVNALYFNPLFYARSLHKYDGSSYHHIDPYFGPDPNGDLALMAQETDQPSTWHWTAADKLFLRVVKEAHARKMKVIIDGVFNHTGRDFFAFKNLIQQQQASPYKDWYVVTSFDDPATLRNEFDYKGWYGYKSLPVFAAAKNGHDMAPGPKAYIFNATRRWLDPDNNGNTANGIDGWRLDAAEQRPLEFWAEWNAYVRQINPQAYTTAEIWTDPKTFIVNGGFSATMNYYGFAIPVTGWLTNDQTKPSRLAHVLDSSRHAIPSADAYAMQNLMDSHDTDRLASMIIEGEQLHYTGSNPNEVKYNNKGSDYPIRRPNEHERAIQRLIVLLQMTYVGAPMIYYGDEAGMWGAGDPDDRQPMVWPDLRYDPQTHDPHNAAGEAPQPVGFDQQLFDFYRSAIALHRAHPALSRGEYTLLQADDAADSLVFSRALPNETVVVALNRSDLPQTLTVDEPAAAEPIGWAKPQILFSTNNQGPAAKVTTDGTKLTIALPPLTGVVLGAGR